MEGKVVRLDLLDNPRPICRPAARSVGRVDRGWRPRCAPSGAGSSPKNLLGSRTGDLGFEPRLTDPESVVLPLHQSPRRAFLARFLFGCLGGGLHRPCGRGMLPGGSTEARGAMCGAVREMAGGWGW